MALYKSSFIQNMSVSISLIQNVFICLVVLLSTAQGIWGGLPLSTTQQIITLAILIILVGLPHGALDHKLGRKLDLYQTHIGGVAFIGGYVGLALLAFIIWLLAPALSLIAFLLISAWHFGSDFKALGDNRYFYPVIAGTAILSAPAILYKDGVIMLFTILVPAESAVTIANAMHYLGFVAIPASLGVAIYFKQYNKLFIEYLFVIIAGVIFQPIVFLTVFFCFSHSPKHLLHLYHDLDYQAPSRFLRDLTPLTLASILLLSIVYFIFKDVGHSETLFKSSIILLAVLTIPHMILIEFQSQNQSDPKGYSS